MSSDNLVGRLLGLFPSWDEVGGVQVSGRAAWNTISSYAESRQIEPVLYQYGVRNSMSRDMKDPFGLRWKSKLEAVLSALRSRGSFELIVIWHLGLLPLVPLLKGPATKTVVFLHGIEAWRRRNVMDRTLLHHVDLFLANSDHTWKRFTAVHPEIVTAEHATVLLGLGKPLEEPSAPPGHPPAALMLGRMARAEDYKGHRELISVWPHIQQQIPGAQLWIAGDGDLRDELERLAGELGLEAVVRFLGQVGETAKQDLLRRCHCLALPSEGEGFGLVYAEAMRMGRPCLVSTADAGREVVAPPEAGLAAAPKDPGELAEALVQLLTPGPRWEEWSRRAQRRYELLYTERHFQERLIAALNGLFPATRPAASVESSI